MKFGTTIMGVSFRAYPEVAAAFEANGFESIWVPEHLVFPADMPPTYPYSGSGYPPVTSDTPSHDPWVVLSYLAAVTSTIRLATGVYILPLRHPLQTARSVVTVDRISGGRVTLGMGVGWLAEEFDYLGVPFRSRGTRADEIIDILRQLWRDDIIEVHSENFDFGPVKFQPKPSQPGGIPIEVGGATPAALRRAGAKGDGWVEIGAASVEDFQEKLGVVLSARAAAGRTGPFEVTASGSLATSLGSGVDGYRRLEEAGATRVLVGPRPREGESRLTPADAISWAQRFADEVISRLA